MDGRPRWRDSNLALAAVLLFMLGTVVSCGSDADDAADDGATTTAATEDGSSATERSSPEASTSEPSSSESSTTDASTTESSTAKTSTTATTTSEGGGAEPAAQVPSPPDDGSKVCADLEVRDDGVYDLGEAGTVTIKRDGATLKLVDIEPGDGWTVDVDDDDDDDDEVELDLRSDDGTEVEFEAEIEEDFELEIEVCARRK